MNAQINLGLWSCNTCDSVLNKYIQLEYHCLMLCLTDNKYHTSWWCSDMIGHSSIEKECVSEIKGDQTCNYNPASEHKPTIRSLVYDMWSFKTTHNQTLKKLEHAYHARTSVSNSTKKTVEPSVLPGEVQHFTSSSCVKSCDLEGVDSIR